MPRRRRRRTRSHHSHHSHRNRLSSRRTVLSRSRSSSPSSSGRSFLRLVVLSGRRRKRARRRRTRPSSLQPQRPASSTSSFFLVRSQRRSSAAAATATSQCWRRNASRFRIEESSLFDARRRVPSFRSSTRVQPRYQLRQQDQESIRFRSGNLQAVLGDLADLSEGAEADSGRECFVRAFDVLSFRFSLSSRADSFSFHPLLVRSTRCFALPRSTPKSPSSSRTLPTSSTSSSSSCPTPRTVLLLQVSLEVSSDRWQTT